MVEEGRKDDDGDDAAITGTHTRQLARIRSIPCVIATAAAAQARGVESRLFLQASAVNRHRTE